jgi:hypothetical protein
VWSPSSLRGGALSTGPAATCRPETPLAGAAASAPWAKILNLALPFTHATRLQIRVVVFVTCFCWHEQGLWPVSFGPQVGRPPTRRQRQHGAAALWASAGLHSHRQSSVAGAIVTKQGQVHNRTRHKPSATAAPQWQHRPRAAQRTQHTFALTSSPQQCHCSSVGSYVRNRSATWQPLITAPQDRRG